MKQELNMPSLSSVRELITTWNIALSLCQAKNNNDKKKQNKGTTIKFYVWIYRNVAWRKHQEINFGYFIGVGMEGEHIFFLKQLLLSMERNLSRN